MTRTWRRLRIVDLCEAHVDCVNRTAPIVDEPTPYKMIRTTNVRDGFVDTESVRYVSQETYDRWTRRLVPRRGDIILTREAPLGGVGKLRTDDQVFLGQRLYHFRANEAVASGDFLMYALMGPDLQEQIRSFGSGSTVEHMRLPDIEKLEVNAPPVAEQRRIAGILSAYDDLIENCERRIRILDEMARTLYRETISPTLGQRVVAHELSANGILEIGDGYRAKNSELGTPGLPFARAGNINDGFRFDGADHLAIENVHRAGSKVSRTGDVLFTSKGTVGRFAMVRPQTPRFVYSPQLCFWRSLQADVLSPNFLFRWMQSRDFLDQVDGVKGSTDMADYVSLSNQRRMVVHVPDPEQHRVFNHHLVPIETLSATLTERRDQLSRTRDMLLPRLLGGDLLLPPTQ